MEDRGRYEALRDIGAQVVGRFLPTLMVPKEETPALDLERDCADGVGAMIDRVFGGHLKMTKHTSALCAEVGTDARAFWARSSDVPVMVTLALAARVPASVVLSAIDRMVDRLGRPEGGQAVGELLVASKGFLRNAAGCIGCTCGSSATDHAEQGMFCVAVALGHFIAHLYVHELSRAFNAGRGRLEAEHLNAMVASLGDAFRAELPYELLTVGQNWAPVAPGGASA